MKTVKFSEQRTAVGYSESFHNEGIAVSCKLFHFAQCIAWVWLIFIHAYKDLVYGPVQVGGGGGGGGGVQKNLKLLSIARWITGLFLGNWGKIRHVFSVNINWNRIRPNFISAKIISFGCKFILKHIRVCVCVYVCMYVCMHACMYDYVCHLPFLILLCCQNKTKVTVVAKFSN